MNILQTIKSYLPNNGETYLITLVCYKKNNKLTVLEIHKED